MTFLGFVLFGSAMPVGLYLFAWCQSHCPCQPFSFSIWNSSHCFCKKHILTATFLHGDGTEDVTQREQPYCCWCGKTTTFATHAHPR